MNPFLYQAHPLLYRWVDLFLHPGAYGSDQIAELLLIFLAINFLWALCLPWAFRVVAGIRLSFLKGYALALPACLCYAPPMVTVLSDIAGHAFRFESRFILVFAIFVASQMLAGFYALAIRPGQGGSAWNLAAGEAVSLFLLLVSIPAGLLVLGLNAVLRVL